MNTNFQQEFSNFSNHSVNQNPFSMKIFSVYSNKSRNINNPKNIHEYKISP